MNKNFKTNIKTFFKSFINNRILFERRKNSIFFPLIILISIVLLLALPPYFSVKSLDDDKITKNFPQIEKPMGEILTSSLDCIVVSGVLTCNENAPSLNKVIEGENGIKYTVIVNQKTISLDTNVSLENQKDTDNIIILYNQTIRIRYIHRDYVNEKIDSYEIVGDYSNLEGFSLKQIAQKIENDPTLLKEESDKFIVSVYKSTLKTQLIVNLSSSIISFLMLVFVSCVVLKMPYLFKLKKGFKFIDCFKISLTSAAPSIVICLFLSLLLGFNSIASIFGFLFVIRILFIYFKYIFNNRIFKEIYQQDKDERYNV